jgi:hypothetical protein
MKGPILGMHQVLEPWVEKTLIDIQVNTRHRNHLT